MALRSLVLALLGCVACSRNGAVIEIEAPLDKPESVVHDTKSDLYLVSNVAGGPGDKDGNGFITRISPDGKVERERFIEGGKAGAVLNAPKGLAIVEPYLVVADIDTVRVFQRESGAPVRSIAIEAAGFLNDVLAFDATSVLVSDTDKNRIHRVSTDGQVSLFAEDAKLGGANGLVRSQGDVVVVGFGSGAVTTLDANGQIKRQVTPTAGELDGVVSAWNGKLLASSWKAKAVVELSGANAPSVFSDLASPADMGWDAKRKRLLVPLMGPGKLLVFEAPKD